jgi:hypothetical protein
VRLREMALWPPIRELRPEAPVSLGEGWLGILSRFS